MKGAMVGLSLVAVALLVGFYAVVSNSVQMSAARRAETSSASVAVVSTAKARTTGRAGARVALAGSPRLDD